jgi:citrate lyase subunit beta/citryl-CoA lyase
VTWLFVPGDRQERFSKAFESGADQVIIDLEDAVASDAKDDARGAVVAYLSGGGSAWVRINAAGTPRGASDVEGLGGVPGLRGVMVPKAEDPAELQAVANRLSVPVIALVETARGLHDASLVASAPGVARLAFGSVDFALDVAALETPQSLLYARSQLVIVSRIHGLSAPIDGVTRDVADLSAVSADAQHGRNLGFGAKLCIHPAQVPVVRDTYRPSAAELAWARRVLDAGVGGAARLDGQMLDEPVRERARRLLEGS